MTRSSQFSGQLNSNETLLIHSFRFAIASSYHLQQLLQYYLKILQINKYANANEQCEYLKQCEQIMATVFAKIIIVFLPLP